MTTMVLSAPERHRQSGAIATGEADEVVEAVEAVEVVDVVKVVHAVDAVEAVEVADLYARHRLPLTRLAVLLLGDLASAEDVVQEVFIKLWSRPELLRGVAAPSSYLRTAVANRARSVQRRRKIEREYAVRDETADVEPAEITALLPLEHREVVEAVKALPTRQREVLVLRYWADLTEKEIARTLGITRGTVKSTASRGMFAVAARLRAGNA